MNSTDNDIVGKRRGLRSLIVPGAFVLVALTVLVLLGNWQMRRMAWKNDVIAKVEARVDQPSISFAKAMDQWRDSADVEFVPVTVTGRFLHDRERHLVATRAGVPGWHIYTPLEVAQGTVVFVNRGFVSASSKDPATRADGQTSGTVTLETLARNAPAETPNSFVPDHDLEQNVFTWRDLSAMAAAAGYKSDAPVAPFFLDSRKDSGVSAAGPRGGITRVVVDNKHLGYALTWYGIALTLVGVFAAFAWPRLRGASRSK